jgi:HlyD family secretion protein
MKPRWIAGLFALGAVGAAAVSAAQRRAPTARAEPVTLHERAVARAVVEPVDGVAQVRARVEGRVLRVLVRAGDRVRAGDLLAEIEGDAQRAELRRREAEAQALTAGAQAVSAGARREERAATRAELEAARHDAQLAQDRAARQARLREGGSASEAQSEEARIGAQAARARLAVAEARWQLSMAGGRPEDVRAARERVLAATASLDAARTDLARTRLVAPIDGVVLACRADAGDTITLSAGASEALFEIADAGRVELRAEVEENDALRVARGSAVEVTTLGGGRVLGRGAVVRVGPRIERRDVGIDDVRARADGAVRPIWVRVEPGAEGEPWPIGHRVEVAVLLPPRPVAVGVPRGAVRIDEGRAVVTVRRAALWAERVPVELGAADPTLVEVHGVPAGSVVELQ